MGLFKQTDINHNVDFIHNGINHYVISIDNDINSRSSHLSYVKKNLFFKTVSCSRVFKIIYLHAYNNLINNRGTYF